MSNMSVNVAGVEWKNPVTVASGTFGSGAEYSEFVDLNRLGAVTTKGVANKPWEGTAACSMQSDFKIPASSFSARGIFLF